MSRAQVAAAFCRDIVYVVGLAVLSGFTIGCAHGPATAPPAPPVELRLHPTIGATQKVGVTVIDSFETTAPDGSKHAEPSTRLKLGFALTPTERVAPSTIRFRVDGLELSLVPDDPKAITPEMVEKLARHMAWADGVTGAGSVSDRGAIEQLELPIDDQGDDVTRALKRTATTAVKSMRETMELLGIALPDGAVAPGASWKSTRHAAFAGDPTMPMRCDATYRLVSRDGDRARIALEGRMTIENASPGMSLDGTYRGDVSYDLAALFPVGGEFELEMRGDNGGGGKMHATMHVEFGAP